MTNSGSERRRSGRRSVLDSFAMFISIPKKGGYRLPIHDVSDEGMSFDLDVDGEDFRDFPAQSGEVLDIHFYINASVFIPLRVKLVRVAQGSVRRVGGELLAENTKGRNAFQALVQLVDGIHELSK